jgi:UDP-glucose 4-epimerase
VEADAIVLGAAGFVGRHVARALAADGWRVGGIGHGTWSRNEWLRWGLVEWHNADIDGQALLTYAGAPRLIVQCAGSGSVAFSMAHPEQDFQRSVSSTLATLEFIRVHVPECALVLPSSAAVYGTATSMPIAVDTPNRPLSPYGVHKLIAEDLCRSYGRTYGLRAAVVRLFSVYGTGLRKQLLWDACVKLTEGRGGFGGTGEERRDWLHADDAAALLVAAAAYAAPNCPTVNGGTGTAKSIVNVVSQLNEALGTSRPVVFSGERREGDPIDYEADVSGAHTWGWRPKRALADGLAEYARWYIDGAP